MAEFCKECFMEKIAIPSDGTTEDMLIMSVEPDFCEGCGKIKPFVIEVKEKTYLDKILEDTKELNEELGDKTFDKI